MKAFEEPIEHHLRFGLDGQWAAVGAVRNEIFSGILVVEIGVTAQREWLKRADAQTRAIVNLFKAPDAIEAIAEIIQRIETGKLKIRVRALEVERAVERVAVTQDITLKALIATCMANIGCVLWVTNPGLYVIQAKIALGFAAVMMLQAVKGQLTLSKMLKKEAKYSGSD